MNSFTRGSDEFSEVIQTMRTWELRWMKNNWAEKWPFEGIDWKGLFSTIAFHASIKACTSTLNTLIILFFVSSEWLSAHKHFRERTCSPTPVGHSPALRTFVLSRWSLSRLECDCTVCSDKRLEVLFSRVSTFTLLPKSCFHDDVLFVISCYLVRVHCQPSLQVM